MLTTFYHLQSLLTSIYSKSGGISEIKEIMMLKKNVKKDIQSHFSQTACSNLPRNVQNLRWRFQKALYSFSIILDADKKHHLRSFQASLFSPKFYNKACSYLSGNIRKLHWCFQKGQILSISSLTPIRSIILDCFKHRYFHPNFITSWPWHFL